MTPQTPNSSQSPQTSAATQAPAGDPNKAHPADPKPDPKPDQNSDPNEEKKPDPNSDPKDEKKDAPKGGKAKRKGGKRKRKSEKSHGLDAPDEEKPKRPPQIHTDEEIRGMLDALQAMYPEMTKTGIVKLALRHMCDNIAYLPPINLARPDPSTLRSLAGISAIAGESAKKVVREIIKTKANPVLADQYMADLESDIASYREIRSTTLRMASIPMVPNLPDDVSAGIAVLEFNESECPHEHLQRGYKTCIEILKAYRPAELNLPEDLQDPRSKKPLSENESENESEDASE